MIIVTFDRKPFGWVHPVYRLRREVHPYVRDWDNFVGPASETVNTLNRMLNSVQQEPRVVQSLAAQRAEEQHDKFEVKMDVHQFSPEELDVKMVNNFVVIEGKHEEEKDDHGFVSRHFIRRYELPDDVKPENVVCNLSSDGVLSVCAPRMIEEKPANERAVPINFTGQPAVTNNNAANEDPAGSGDSAN